VSSFGVEWFAGAAGPFLAEKVPVISVTKGLQDQANGDLSTALHKCLPGLTTG